MFPIEPAVLGPFVIAATAIIISPGPDTLVILRHSINGGRGAGLAAVGGVQIGLLVHTLLAVAGISIVIASSPPLLKAVTVFGAAYLAWLGLQSFRGGGGLQVENTHGGRAQSAIGKALKEAALCNLLNPKVILLFMALYPGFVDFSRPDVVVQLLTLSIILITINVIWQSPIALAADAIQRWVTNPDFNRAINRLSGGILIIMAGLMLAGGF
ncbi:MAG: LysE family translocator [Rhodospirillales bacterium]